MMDYSVLRMSLSQPVLYQVTYQLKFNYVSVVYTRGVRETTSRSQKWSLFDQGYDQRMTEKPIS